MQIIICWSGRLAQLNTLNVDYSRRKGMVSSMNFPEDRLAWQNGKNNSYQWAELGFNSLLMELDSVREIY